MALFRTMTSAGLLVYALRLADAQTSSSSSCELLTVAGGVSPGSYARTGQPSEDGRSVYAQTGSDGETTAVLLFAQSGVTGRRLLANEEGRWAPSAGTTPSIGASADGRDRREQPSPAVGETITEKPGRQRHRQHQYRGGGASNGGGDFEGAGVAAPLRSRSLTGCARGFWINRFGDGGSLVQSTSGGSSSSFSSAASASTSSPSLDGVLFPVYAVPDCADHPADIVTDWFAVECAACELEDASPAVVIECDDETAGATATPAPVATPAPAPATTPVPTPAPTPAPTPTPTIIYDTPGPTSDENATPGPVDTVPPTPETTTATPVPSSIVSSPSPVASYPLLSDGLETVAPSYSNGAGSAPPSIGGGGGGGDDDDGFSGGSNTPSPEGGGGAETEGGGGSVTASKAERVVPSARGLAAAAVVVTAAAAVVGAAAAAAVLPSSVPSIF